MAHQADSKAERKGRPPRRQTEQEFSQEFSHLWALCRDGDVGTGIVLRWRGMYDILAIAKRVTDDEQHQVAFATGSGMFEALHALNAVVGRDGWKEDKYAGK